ncbi:hypothetical protein G647_00458 [Cladophialophora carrionii CBS 160.54]|uniref:F-box domain-containing protein n=1 Tax=Cladophialophora carrionii CBS 160.54 TaxID=1279043 RepID=V9DM79_9EURO|nr:uncharacterized protein G647_00458 [Cladophialophora carrionii CBS 160.54]ETI28009.1 hypothetical protein G647_00458 [Cladophialophora carrionii CBS 160.54]
MEAPVEVEEASEHLKAAGTEGLLEKHLQGKKQEWDVITAHKEPLRLLDLPMDILQVILKELTHTNDLTSLALTHSALHALVIPHIYARFDIVWPDANATFENRMGVDALTYGLATLVMAQDVFGEAPYQSQHAHQCQQCGHYNQPAQHRPVTTSKNIRRGNHFAQFTRKFSLGNGPADWVQEYLITKEGGKMLGTLVALAVGRMRNLETFIWDMPTGVLRDVWMALASLGNRHDGQACRLERVWVRWHDNQDQGPLASPPPPGALPGAQNANMPYILAGPANSLFQIPPYPRVEFPTFSILPPLKSLSVLDIDELPYAEEMSVLIDRSLDRLTELRVGMAAHAQYDMWARPSEERPPVLPSLVPGMTDQTPRPGGMLGILVHRFCDAFSHHKQSRSSLNLERQRDPLVEDVTVEGSREVEREDDAEELVPASDINQLGVLMSAYSIHDDELDMIPAPTPKQRTSTNLSNTTRQDLPNHSSDSFLDSNKEGRSARKLTLETLELERVYLSIAVLSKAVDWSRLTTLTLLSCRNHEQLWKALRKRFTPSSRRRVSSTPYRTSSNGMSSMVLRSQTSTPSTPAPPAADYALKLKRLHTDTVSPSLIAFIKDTLAPDSLEWLFLQENTAYKSPVSIDMIYKGAVRRHRSSLTKLLIDSTFRTEDSERPNTNWRRWVFNRDLITCITSGKMKLRELSMSIDYKDWHYFLRRLPNATTLRSLHISHIAEHVNGTVHSREAALQVLDIVALRPELELCYLGIQGQCFEILEYASPRKCSASSGGDFSADDIGPDGDGMAPNHTDTHNVAADNHHDDSHDDEADDHADGNEDSDFDAVSDEADDLSDDGEGNQSGDGTGSGAHRPTWRLREILFYDDKISIFKARHGRL